MPKKAKLKKILIEILPFAPTWLDLENITLSEVSQRKSRATRFHSYVGYKTENNK